MARILVIAGSDSSGGAGIQGDIKTIHAMGGYAATAITALTAQNSLGVQAVLPVPADFLRQQIRAVVDDIGVDAIKTGMLHNAELVQVVAEEIERAQKIHHCSVVIDPVLVSGTGRLLLEIDAIDIMKTQLFPLADLITPNIPEALSLTNLPASNSPYQLLAPLQQLKPRAVLLKGGHAAIQEIMPKIIVDYLQEPHQLALFTHPYQYFPHNHGTGCALASAIAVGLAQGLPCYSACFAAINWLQYALKTAPALGKGNGPINHAAVR